MLVTACGVALLALVQTILMPVVALRHRMSALPSGDSAMPASVQAAGPSAASAAQAQASALAPTAGDESPELPAATAAETPDPAAPTPAANSETSSTMAPVMV